MKHLFCFCFLVFTCSLLQAQRKNKEDIAASPSPENTYALVVGIANYENDRLNLNYSNRDAEEFASYLRSSSGGNIPEDNIRLLIDTNATTAAIYNSLKWLKKKTELTQAQDGNTKSLVYIYFSGHGDVETNTRANLGFLLAYNTPPNNYLNNAVRIEDLNDYAHTLSVDLNANVIIITDACHSGKLAGSDYRGSYLVGTDLSMARDREIRIASCNPDELSMEDQRWGNGRGVFSWYLINGLKGMADRNNDQTVTLNEAQQYVDSAIAADPVLKELKHKQTPVLRGNKQFRLAAISPEVMLTLMSSPVAPVVSIPITELFWRQLNDSLADVSQINFISLQSKSRKEIPVLFLQEAKKILVKDPDALYIIKHLQEMIAGDSLQFRSFSDKLVEWIHTKGQEVINQYLSGDEAALEKRRYYNIKSSGYDIYPALFATALQLVDPTDQLYHILSLNQLYFTGVAARLKIPLVNEAEQKKIIEQVLGIQLKALEMDDNAAFVQNELGILYQYKNDKEKAAQYYTRASELAPSWAIPKANLCGLYITLKDTAKAAAAGAEAEQLQPELQNVHINLGRLDEQNGNYLYAEERYRKAIDINSRHFFPFERLGNVYLQTTHYALADSFYHEAALRKKGFHFNANAAEYLDNTIVFPPLPFSPCDIDTSRILPDDIMAFFYWGLMEYGGKRYASAERQFKKIIALDPDNPLVFHYLGKIYYDQQQWENAEIMFAFAEQYHLPVKQFNQYCDSLVKGKKYPYVHTCFEENFRNNYYPLEEDLYFLATAYESWNHFEEAESRFRQIIRLNPVTITGYLKLWQLLEKQDRYTEAETVIQSFKVADAERSDRELRAFYLRAINRFPENGDWYYHLGLLLYNRSARPSMQKYLDSIIWFPRLNKEVQIDLDNYKQLGSQLAWDKNDPNSPDKVFVVDFEEQPAGVVTPGTRESFMLAEPIYTPRRDAIYFLRIADSLQSETNTKADINFKIGNVFVWSGSNKQAFPYYVRSVALQPDNANARLNLVDVSKAIYKNREGFAQLTYLYDIAQINFPKRMLYGEWCIHAGQFDKAAKVLSEAKSIYPYAVPEINDLLGRMYLLRKEPVKAIPFYKQFAGQNKKDASALYTIAKLYQQSGNTAEAWKWLGLALQNGFNYGFVLEADTVWETLRKTAQWKSLLAKFRMKQYREPKL
jgi:tetratricopeptide (TPR) repeat protein